MEDLEKKLKSLSVFDFSTSSKETQITESEREKIISKINILRKEYLEIIPDFNSELLSTLKLQTILNATRYLPRSETEYDHFIDNELYLQSINHESLMITIKTFIEKVIKN